MLYEFEAQRDLILSKMDTVSTFLERRVLIEQLEEIERHLDAARLLSEYSEF